MGYPLWFILSILMVAGESARAGNELIQIRGFFRIPSIFPNLRSGAKTWGRLSGRPPSRPQRTRRSPWSDWYLQTGGTPGSFIRRGCQKSSSPLCPVLAPVPPHVDGPASAFRAFEPPAKRRYLD
jgi:hypothetical protein